MVATVFVIVPDGLFRFALPKISCLAAALLVAFLAPSRARLAPDVVAAAATVLGVFVVAALVADRFGSAFWGRWPRYEGVPTVMLYLLLLVAGARLLGSGTLPHRKNWWIRLVAAAMIVLAVLALADAFGVRLLGDSSEFRPGATLGNATDMGIVGLVGCAILLPKALWARTAMPIIGAAAGAVVALASGSRAVLIVLGVLVLTGTVWKATHWWKRGNIRTGLAAIVSAPLLLAAAVMAFPSVRDRLTEKATVSGRIDLWTAAWDLAKSHLWIGIGPGHFVDALPSVQTAGFAARVGTDYPSDSPHMITLQWLIDGGAPLLAANVLLASTVLWIGIRNLQRAQGSEDRLFLLGCLAATFAFGAVLFTHFPSAGTTALAGICAGALAHGVPIASTQKPPPPRKTALAAAASQHRPQTRTRTTSVVHNLTAGLVGLILLAALSATAAEVPMKRANEAVFDGRLQEASALFEDAASMRPWDTDAALLASQSFAARASAGDSEAGVLAQTWASRSLAKNPGSVESLTSLAVGQLAEGQINAASETLTKARKLAPVNSQILLQSGLAEWMSGRPETASAFIEQAVTLAPNPDETLRILASLYAESGNMDKASETLSRLKGP